MRYVALFLGLVMGTSGFAAKPAKVAGAAGFARKIAGASSWDSLFKSVDGDLNPLVMKELRSLTNELPYPQMRMKNDRLMISNENGEHLTMVLFEKNGDVSFNGKRWEIQPLATTETEVKRIAGILGVAQASLWDYVVAPAQAAGLGMTMGVAAAAYTSAASWKAEACAKPNPSDDLVKTCSLMAVSMEGTDPGMEKFYPVSLKCPDKNGGVLELVKKNRIGKAIRFQVTYKDNIAQKGDFAVSDPQSTNKFIILIRSTDNSLDASKKTQVANAFAQTDALLNQVCLAGAYDRYKAVLDSYVKIVMSSTDTPSDRQGKDGKASSGL